LINTIYLKNVSTLKLNTKKCTGCGMCVKVCPHAVFVIEKKKAIISEKDKCMECGACALNCPAKAIKVDSGVGCAYGIINGWLKGSDSSCDCGGDSVCCGD
jgi:NAD-dependent dihydropyrimidine dehydrogenase PreA subunit